jgi:hypothetical protein
MKTIASTSRLLVGCLASAVVSLGWGSCGSSSAGTETAGDAAPPRDGGAGADVAADARVYDAASADSAAEAAPEGGACGEPYTGLGATCDDCIVANCDPTWCACAEDPDGAAGDGGSCLSYVKCVEQCVTSDAGSPSDCLTSVCAASPLTGPEQAGHAFLDCLIQYCASECGQ